MTGGNAVKTTLNKAIVHLKQNHQKQCFKEKLLPVKDSLAREGRKEREP